jgi:hypothetical protein
MQTGGHCQPILLRDHHEQEQFLKNIFAFEMKRRVDTP